MQAAKRSSFVTNDEFNAMKDAYNLDPEGPFAYDGVFNKVADIVTIKHRYHTQDIDDLIQNVQIRVFKQWASISTDPHDFFSKDGRTLTDDNLGKCFQNYVLQIARNAMLDMKGVNLPEPTDEKDLIKLFAEEEKRLAKEEMQLTDEEELANEIKKTTKTVSVYRLCLKVLFQLKSRPYTLLGFCFNALIHFDETGRNLRGSSSHTAKVIELKTLGTLRNEFRQYHEDYLRPVPSEIIKPLDTKLEGEFDGTKYILHIIGRFYNNNPNKTISDWTTNTKRALVPKLMEEPEIIHFLDSEGYKRGE